MASRFALALLLLASAAPSIAEEEPSTLDCKRLDLIMTPKSRHGSGGKGAHRGGDGVVRRIRFREPMTAAILANRRRVPPFGLMGGDAGAAGRNWVERVDGRIEELPATARAEMAAGDVFVIETPGGGGYGRS